jgi:hypothetical protein
MNQGLQPLTEHEQRKQRRLKKAMCAAAARKKKHDREKIVDAFSTLVLFFP